MSDSDIENFVRINRPELVADTNLKQAGSLNVSIVNPVQKEDGAYLLSRVGGLDTGDGRKPVSGYCVKFDVNNQNVFIQTNISSTNALDNWNITIKGEGTVDVLYVDTTGDYIAIKQKQALTGSDYFNLSYIAFVSRTSGKIEHLFECEENSGLYLYDAITGDTAFFTTDGTTAIATSLTDLRSSATSKEWIRDEGRNLDNKLSFPTFIEANQTNVTNSTIPVIPNFDGMTIKIPFTIVFTGKFLSSDSITFGRYELGYAGYSGINTYKDTTAQNFTVRDVPSGNSVNNYVSFNKIYDGIEHKFIWVVGSNPNNTSKMMFFVDGEDCIITNSGNGDISLLSSVTFSGGSSGTNKFFIAGKNRYIKDFKIFNFDISANDAPYTIQDYQNGKDVPSGLLSNCDLSNPSIGGNQELDGAPDNTLAAGVVKEDIEGGNSYTIYNTTSSSAVRNYKWKLKDGVTFKKGSQIKFSWDSIVYDGSFSGAQFGISIDSTSYKVTLSQGSENNWTTDTNTIEFIAEKDFTFVKLYVWLRVNSTIVFTNPRIKINGTLLNLNNATPTTLLDSSLNNNNATLAGTFELPNKEYGTWCNSVGATFNRLVLWDKDYSADTTISGANGCWVTAIAAWARNNNAYAHFNNSLDGNTLKITSTASWTGGSFNVYLGANIYSDSNQRFKFKASKIIFNFDSIKYSINNTENQAQLFVQLVYEKTDGSSAEYYMRGSNTITMDTSNLTNYTYIKGIIIRPEFTSSTFAVGDYIAIENFSIIAENANIFNNSFITNGYNPLPINIPRKVLI